MKPAEPIKVKYTNYHGITAVRTITPNRIEWGSDPFHPDDQWLLICWDHDKKAQRTYALKDCDFINIQPIAETDSRGILSGFSPDKLIAGADIAPGEEVTLDQGQVVPLSSVTKMGLAHIARQEGRRAPYDWAAVADADMALKEPPEYKPGGDPQPDA